MRPFNKIFKKWFCCFELSGFIVKRAETDQLVKQTVGEIVGGKVVQVCLRVGILSDLMDPVMNSQGQVVSTTHSRHVTLSYLLMIVNSMFNTDNQLNDMLTFSLT